MISVYVRMGVPDLLGGGGVGWLKSGSARGPDGSQFRA